MTVSQIIYTAAGRPVMPGDIGGYCIACGISGAGLPAGEWIKDTFMDHDKLHDGSVVCHSCLFCFDDRSSALTTITGKDKPQRMRNYSHFVVNGRWHPLSKAAKVKKQPPDLTAGEFNRREC